MLSKSKIFRAYKRGSRLAYPLTQKLQAQLQIQLRCSESQRAALVAVQKDLAILAAKVLLQN